MDCTPKRPFACPWCFQRARDRDRHCIGVDDTGIVIPDDGGVHHLLPRTAARRNAYKAREMNFVVWRILQCIFLPDADTLLHRIQGKPSWIPAVLITINSKLWTNYRQHLSNPLLQPSLVQKGVVGKGRGHQQWSNCSLDLQDDDCTADVLAEMDTSQITLRTHLSPFDTAKYGQSTCHI